MGDRIRIFLERDRERYIEREVRERERQREKRGGEEELSKETIDSSHVEKNYGKLFVLLIL